MMILIKKIKTNNNVNKKERHQNYNLDIVNAEPSNLIWIQTPLSNFGFKCMANKHDLCTSQKCACLCHCN